MRLPRRAVDQGPWLYVDLLPRRAGDSPLRGDWEADLVAGALRDLAAARGQRALAGVTVWRAPTASSGSCCSRMERQLRRVRARHRVRASGRPAGR